jgi:hypothetical protein
MLAHRVITPATWVFLAALTGFASSAVFSGWLQWPRDWFVLGHAFLVGLFLAAFARRSGVRPMVQLRRRWPFGLLVGLLLGAILAQGVLGPPPSPRPTGGALGGALLWLAVVYGVVDALLLSVVPVLALYGTRTADEMRRGITRLHWGGIALLGSLAVTAAYHAGFTEFRGPALTQPLIGNGIITVSYLLTGSPVAPLTAHVIMHGAAVLHGPGTTVQLPPHH